MHEGSTLLGKQRLEEMVKLNDESRKEKKVGIENGFTTAARLAKKQQVDEESKKFKKVERMKKALNGMKDKGCVMCQVLTGEAAKVKHTVFQCGSLRKVERTFGDVMRWKQGIKYGRKHKGMCWKCHVLSCQD